MLAKKSQDSSVTLSVVTEHIFHEMINKVRTLKKKILFHSERALTRTQAYKLDEWSVHHSFCPAQ